MLDREVEVARSVCEEFAAVGVPRCVVSYFGARGQPVLVVDNGAAPDIALVLPLVAADGLLGSIGCGFDQRISRELEHALFGMAARVSVRLALLGVARPAPGAPAPTLTRRQHEVATLAARGLTNSEIGVELRIAVNTVKNRLKEVFERLRITGRIELVRALPRVAPRGFRPLGVTREGPVTITCIADVPS